MSLLDRYDISDEMLDWAMESFRQLAEQEATSRSNVQTSQASAITSIQNQLDKLLDAYTRDLIDDTTFSAKGATLKQELAKLQEEQAQTSQRAKNWFEVASDTLQKLANATESFNKGDLATKKDILLAIGQNPVLVGGIVQITPNPWVIPIAEGTSDIRRYLEVARTNPQQIEKASEEAIISTWQPLVEELRTISSF